MIKNLLFVAGAFMVVFLNSCSSSKMSIVASWVNTEEIKPEPYKSVFIIVLSGNLPAKKAIENDLATAAEARGLKAYKSVVVFGPFSGKESIPSKDIISKKTASLGVEALFTVALVNKEIETTYVPGTTYVSGPIYPTYGYYGTFGGYYNNYSSVYYDPGYYSTDKKYTLEANMYDAKTEKLLMSIETKAVNPADIEKASQEYTALLAEAIAKLRPMKK